LNNKEWGKYEEVSTQDLFVLGIFRKYETAVEKDNKYLQNKKKDFFKTLFKKEHKKTLKKVK